MALALKDRLLRLKLEVVALAFACRDPRTPWYAKVLPFLVVAYAVSPIDLIPDPIPILGTLDDLLILPVGILLSIRFIPPEVMQDSRAKAQTWQETPGAPAWLGLLIVLALWLLILLAVAALL